ncbi:UV DNA damage repair endonuclease UvsE [Cohnella terricola]|uniref:UV DNA damage repair endonuclease UvsE n=1 Tax=Cohnella terricola TaxID=1289167 RepID=A0A559JTK9_9BACL|nr:UV DNA damage repair endonuclease UvsE [Cohnella terricola]TVY03213.1 UV DNA damage repair endonuclease UvsE [Cohnella terricola]
MIVRFGYVAMSMELENASPSRTMTMASFSKLADREAGLRRLERIAEENLQNTLRLLKHNRYLGVHVYRMTSKIIPLATHDALKDWNPYPALAQAFAEVGAFVREQGMRVSFHPDHFTVLSTPREEVFRKSVDVLDYHVRMLEAMGLDGQALNNIHVGGSYGDKAASGRRFIDQFAKIERRITERLTLENDDKTFTAAETLAIAEEVGVPMVLDIHHHAVNPGGEQAIDLWPRILATWDKLQWNVVHAGTSQVLPPKIHASSPKNASDPRGHADYLDMEPLLSFLRSISSTTPAVDVMIEAKRKDQALLKLMDEFRALEAAGEEVRVLDGGTVELPC